MRSVALAIALVVVASSAGAAEATLGVRYADAMASLERAFTMQRTAHPGGVEYRGTAGTATLRLHVRGDLVREAELTTEDVAMPDAETAAAYARNYALRGRFVTNVLPAWHAAALAWIDESLHDLSPPALAGDPQERSMRRAGTELRLDVVPAGSYQGRQMLRLTLNAHPDPAAEPRRR